MNIKIVLFHSVEYVSFVCFEEKRGFSNTRYFAFVDNIITNNKFMILPLSPDANHQSVFVTYILCMVHAVEM